MLLALLTAFTCGASAQSVSLCMIDVGKGDAILVFVDERTYLIDAGKSSAWDSVEAALARFNVTRLDGVFLTHTDKDHSGGLKKLAKSDIEIDAWYASSLCATDKDDNPIYSAAKKRGQKVTRLSAGDVVDDLFYVLAPLSLDEYNEDNNSLVMLLKTSRGNVLLVGDMEAEEELELIESGVDLSCTVFKVPNHGDDDVCVTDMIDNLGAKAALISTDPYDKPGTPDEWLVQRLKWAGMSVYSTYTCGDIYVELQDGQAVVETVR